MSASKDWKETIPEGEDAELLRFAEQLRDLQRKRARSGKADRALHAKGNLGVEAELEVLADLPDHARVGLFADPGTYRAYVRYSNGSGSRQDDRKPDVRGVAIKVLGVPGKKIIPGMEDAKTQDFLLIRTPATPFRDAREFVALVRAASSPALLLPRVLWAFGPGRALSLLKELSSSLSQPLFALESTRYFSALPIKYGDYAVHYALSPRAPEGDPLDGASAEHLGEALSAELRRGSVTYDFQVQFYVDAQTTPIEDASVEWKAKDAPFVTVARLTLLQQDTRSARGIRISEAIEAMGFDPWHALEDHRPLGNMMRARNHAYRLSTMERGAAKEPEEPIE